MKPENFFLITATLFGFVYLLIVPPFQSPDEFNHFYRAWQITEGGLVGQKTVDNRLGDSLPESLVLISKPFQSLPFQPQHKIKSDTIFQYLKIQTQPEQKTFIDFSNTAIYAPTAYLPQSFAIFLFKPKHITQSLIFTPLSIFYLARFFTLIFWLSTIYVSIKILPFQKNLFALLALLPSSLFINSSVNADVVTNAFSFLLIALLCKFISTSQKVTSLYGLLFIITTAIITLNKIAYLPILLLFLFIQSKNFGSQKRKIAFLILLAATNVALAAWWSNTIAPLYIPFEEYNQVYRVGQQLNEGVNPQAQWQFICQNPLAYGKILVVSIFKTLPHTLIHYLGKFGWEKNYLPIYLLAPLFLLLILRGGIVPNSKFQIPNSKLGIRNLKFGIFIIGILMSLSLATAMYLIWCPVGSPFIENLGGKYFIPIFPLFFLALPTVNWGSLRFFVRRLTRFARLPTLKNQLMIHFKSETPLPEAEKSSAEQSASADMFTAIWLWLCLLYAVWQVFDRYYL